MLSKMAQPNNVGGGGGASASGGRRVPMSLTGAGAGGTTVSRLQQSNGRSNSPQNSNMSKKNESNISMGPFVALKKSSVTQQRSPSTSSTASTSSSSSSAPKDDEKKGQNGINKSTNSNQNGSSNTQAVREQQKPKEKQSEKKEPVKPEVKDEAAKPVKPETKPTAPPSAEAKIEVATAAAKKIEAAATKKVEPAAVEVIDLDNEPEVAAVSNTPTSERKSSRRVAAAATSQQKSPSKPQQSDSPSSKKQPEEAEQKPEAVEDVEMEPLTVDASPIRHHVASTQPTATSTPGRNLFGFRSSSKPTNEVELAAQPSSSPATAPARSFAQISGRRSIRPTATLTPGKLGSYRCVNSDLDTSSCTNTSMNATVGSEIPNSSSFSFSFFGRGRKRERTPPPLTGSQSANDLAQDVEMSPPKRARFDLFSLNLASPFTMLRSRFSKTTISTPSTRQRHDQTPPAGDDDEVGGVQNVSGTINQEEEQQQLNKSSGSDEVTVGQEAGLETPKKSGTPVKDVVPNENVEGEGVDAVANSAADVPVEGEGANRSRCAIM
ncbi:nucleolar and coiled-body phosphoprotein 1 [Drosophila novamexicana]|uniref:nucleolar and coiled-body phosphoprotein 1 n=1 Tax=Drosophila novamexicana TaxID=47314 RepID=UPI0011E5E6DB|nr:nucleolar and coiled-body phosphoprotein 1 [Drosophila novamexicana]XP_030562879.1 nucleolar and coiled-body phosphoprotein 1 [Drosophila novamexicana]XP_030562880.1 nucleolar and coiled-body phosphoprotein 1 [Drosophila novamexicana]